MLAYNKYLSNPSEISDISQISNYSNNLRLKNIKLSYDNKSFSMRSPDLNDPKEVGWSFLINSKETQISDIIGILKPLSNIRGMEDPEAPFYYDDEVGSDYSKWITDNYYSLEMKSKKVPQYLLLIGNPKTIPFRLQSFLDVTASTGRLDFDSRDELVLYIEKILEHEKNKIIASKKSLLFGTNRGIDDPTYYSCNYLVKPLAGYISSKLNFDNNLLLDKDATKVNFVNQFNQYHPALIFTATHGVGSPNTDLSYQKKLNGAMYCQNSDNLSKDETVFSSQDISDLLYVDGSIFFQFACFGYGTPAESDFSHWRPKGENSPVNSSEDFVSALPKKLLSVKGGPIAYIGHVDKGWVHGFTDPDHPEPILEKWDNRIYPFTYCIRSLLSGEPVGRSLSDFNSRYNEQNAIITNIIDKTVKKSVELTPKFFDDIADIFVTRSDAQNYMVFGDPAVSINI